MTDPYSPMKQLENAAAKMLETTAMGHMRIVKPAIGMQAVSRNGPSRLIRSCVRRNQPLNSMYGLLMTIIAV